MTIELTPKQSAVLSYIRLHAAQHGYSPTFNEISRYFGWKSDNAAYEHVACLIAKGFVAISRGKTRSIVIIDEPYSATCPNCGHAMVVPA